MIFLFYISVRLHLQQAMHSGILKCVRNLYFFQFSSIWYYKLG